MNIWIFNHHALTQDMSGGTKYYDFAKELAQRGHRVTIEAYKNNPEFSIKSSSLDFYGTGKASETIVNELINYNTNKEKQ